MNETMPPKDTPLYRIINKPEHKSCENCKHLWYVDGLYGCGISGKLILAAFIENSGCDNYIRTEE